MASSEWFVMERLGLFGAATSKCGLLTFYKQAKFSILVTSAVCDHKAWSVMQSSYLEKAKFSHHAC